MLTVASPAMAAGPVRLGAAPAVPDGAHVVAAVPATTQMHVTVTLQSQDPTAHPRILQRFLATDADWKALRAGVHLAREVAAQPTMRPYIEREFLPGSEKTAESDIDAHIRKTSITVHTIKNEDKEVVITDKTTFEGQSGPAKAEDVKVGDRVVIHCSLPRHLLYHIQVPGVQVRGLTLVRGVGPEQPHRQRRLDREHRQQRPRAGETPVADAVFAVLGLRSGGSLEADDRRRGWLRP